MSFTKESAVEKAKADLAKRLKLGEKDVREKSVTSREFADMSLGAPAKDEFAAQMIATGWEIKLSAGGRDYIYRADKYQLRLKDFKGENVLVVG